MKDSFIAKADAIIQSMDCSVFEDEHKTTEWVWKKHKIPIQYRREMFYDNISQITTVQLRNIQTNIQIADSLFEIPRN